MSHRHRNSITSVQNRKTDNSTLFDMTYAYQDGTLYDSVGNPLVRTEAVDGTTYTTTYRYDAVNRQVSESRTPGAYSLSYGYDAVGNRTTRTLDGTTYTNVHDDNNKLTSASGGGLTASFGYDSNGNMTSVSGTMYTAKTLVYNDANRLTSITYSGVTDTYTYNWQGLRTRALLSGTYQRYFYDGERVLEDLNDSGGTLARYTVTGGTFQDMLLGFQRNDGSVRYPISDKVGSARRLVDGSATVTDAYSLDAFGRNMFTSGSTPNPYRYGAAWGYTTDPSGMLQLGARFYWPELGRFVSQDPAGDGMNWYAYVDSEPLTSTDPGGMRKETRCERRGRELWKWLKGEQAKCDRARWRDSFLYGLGGGIVGLATGAGFGGAAGGAAIGMSQACDAHHDCLNSAWQQYKGYMKADGCDPSPFPPWNVPPAVPDHAPNPVPSGMSVSPTLMGNMPGQVNSGDSPFMNLDPATYHDWYHAQTPRPRQ